MPKNNKKRKPTIADIAGIDKRRAIITELTGVILENPVSRWLRFLRFFAYAANYIRSSLITKMILASWVLLASAVIISGGASYLVAMPALEDEIKYTGKTTVTTFVSSNVILFQEEDGATILQLYLDNIIQADKEDGRILDAIVFDENLKILARKDKTKVNEEGIAKQWKHLKGISSVRIDKDEKSFVTIAAPVIYSEDTDPVGFVVFIFSQAPVEKARAEIIRMILILLGLMILIGGTYIGSFMYRRLSPVRKVTKAFEAMDKGDFDVKVEVPKGNDEVTLLAIAANKHQGIQRRSKRYTHPACQQIVGGKISEEPREKYLVNVFLDICDSTQRARRDPIDEVVDDLNFFFDLVNAWAQQFKCTSLNNMGDGEYKAFGVLTKEPIDIKASQSSLVCMAGVQILMFAAASSQMERSSKSPLVCRIGMATGKVLLARVGTSYTGMGDSVNYAARLQDKCRPGFIASDNHLLLNSAWPLEKGEDGKYPKEELMKDRGKWKRKFVITEGPSMIRVKGYGKKKLPIFHIEGLTDPTSNDDLRKRLRAFVKNPVALAILEKAFKPEQLMLFKEYLANKLSEEKLLLSEPPPEWFIPEDEDEDEEEDNGNG